VQSSTNPNSTNMMASLAPPVNSRMSASEIRVQSCNVCHVTLRASMPNVPSLTNVPAMSLAEFETTVTVGKGLMPAFPTLEEGPLVELYGLLGGTNTARDIPEGRGPARDGAGFVGNRGRNVMRAYPEGVTPPANTYKVGLGGYGMETRDLLSPPWS